VIMSDERTPSIPRRDTGFEPSATVDSLSLLASGPSRRLPLNPEERSPSAAECLVRASPEELQRSIEHLEKRISDLSSVRRRDRYPSAVGDFSGNYFETNTTLEINVGKFDSRRHAELAVIVGGGLFGGVNGRAGQGGGAVECCGGRRRTRFGYIRITTQSDDSGVGLCVEIQYRQISGSTYQSWSELHYSTGG